MVCLCVYVGVSVRQKVEEREECVSYTCLPLIQYVNCHGTELQSAKRLQTANWINLWICVKEKNVFFRLHQCLLKVKIKV